MGNRRSQGPLDLGSALVRLAYEEREALVLSICARLSYREAAKVCGCEIDEYAARLNNGLRQLAELLPTTCLEDPASRDFSALEAAGSLSKTAALWPVAQSFRIQ